MRPGSLSECALMVCLLAAQKEGADTLRIAGPELALPMYVPGGTHGSAAAENIVAALRRCDGLIIASPSYHGSVSGLIKNALDYVEDLRDDRRAYLDGRAIGCLACASGWQGGGQTLATLRSIAHALRGWPTPLGAVINTSSRVFDESGNCVDQSLRLQLETIGRQVVEFAERRVSRPTAELSLG
jgi:FMN reductase